MMTRKHLALSLAAVVIAGCKRGWNIPPDQLDPTPIATDSAMEKRQWDQSKATYAWTGVQTYPTLETWKPAENQPFYYEYGEVPMFLGNIVASPYAAYKTPPWRLQEYRGATVEPTFTAMPPLPPETEAPPAAAAPTEPMAPAEPAAPVQPAQPEAPTTQPG